MNGDTQHNGNSNLLDSINFDNVLEQGDEFYQVDDFFNSYVAELSQQRKRAGEPGLDASEAKHFRGAAEGMSHPPLVPGIPPTTAGTAAVNQPFVNQAPLAVGGVPAVFQINPALLANVPPGTLLPNMFAGQIPSMMPSAQTQQDVAPAVYSSDGGTGPRNKSEKQQAANKAAQARYRERKKLRFLEMEKTVQALREELAQSQALQQRNAILEGMNSALQKTLVEQEREVERLKVILDTQAEQSIYNSHSEGGSPPSEKVEAGTSTNPFGAGNGNVSCDMLPRDLTGIDFKSGFADQIQKLRQFLEQHNLTDAKTCRGLGSELSPTIVNQLGEIVGRCCNLCQAAIRAEGVKVLDLIIGDENKYAHRGAFMGAGSDGDGKTCDAGALDRALDVMQMTEPQQEQLLMMRAAHLNKVREIYAERQTLNMRAMALMLPTSSRVPGEDNTLEGRMENMSKQGYLLAAKSNAELAEVLDAIKDNLRREQRLVMELNCGTMSRVLSPLQAARYMTVVYPKHCDALALSNVLAQRREKQGKPVDVDVVSIGGTGRCGSTSACG